MSTITTDTFLYDGECAFCQRVVQWLRERSDGSVAFAPATAELLRETGVSATEAEQAAVLVTRNGQHFPGALAFGEVLRRSDKYDRRLAGRLLLEQPSREVARWVYAFVSKNRHRLSKCGGDVCGTTR